MKKRKKLNDITNKTTKLFVLLMEKLKNKRGKKDD